MEGRNELRFAHHEDRKFFANLLVDGDMEGLVKEFYDCFKISKLSNKIMT